MENCESPNRWDCPIYNLKCISGVSELFTDKCSHCWFMGSSRYRAYLPFCMVHSSVRCHDVYLRAAEGGCQGLDSRVQEVSSPEPLGFGPQLMTWFKPPRTTLRVEDETFLSWWVSVSHYRRLCWTQLLSAEPHGHRWRPHPGGHEENFPSDGHRSGVFI